MYCKISLSYKILGPRLLRWLNWFMYFWFLYLHLLASFLAETLHASCWVQFALVSRCCWIVKLCNMVHSSAACRYWWLNSSSGSVFFTLVYSCLVRVSQLAAKVYGSVCFALVRSCASLASKSALLFWSWRAWRLLRKFVFYKQIHLRPFIWYYGVFEP